MCPGLAMCPACSQLIQNPKNWEAHHVSVKHQKCSETLTAIGIPGDYTSPVGASAPGTDNYMNYLLVLPRNKL